MGGPNGWQRFISGGVPLAGGAGGVPGLPRAEAARPGRPGQAADAGRAARHAPRATASLIFTADNATVYQIARRSWSRRSRTRPRRKERRQILERFHSGEYPVVVTSQVLNEGVDVPAANVGIVLSGTGTRPRARPAAGPAAAQARRTSRRCCTRSWPAARPRSSPASAGGSTTLPVVGRGQSRHARIVVTDDDCHACSPASSSASAFDRNRLIPSYLRRHRPGLARGRRAAAGVFRAWPGRTRGEIEEEIHETIGDNPTQLVHQGLAKLLEDRCEFEVDSELRARTSCARRSSWPRPRPGSADRAVRPGRRPAAVAGRLGTTPDVVERGLFADLKSEQRLIAVRRQHGRPAPEPVQRGPGPGDPAALDRRRRSRCPARRRPATASSSGRSSSTGSSATSSRAARKLHLRLDGPLSLFSATQKYGLQLAFFLPALLQCKRFELNATVRWGAQRKEKVFALNDGDGLRSHTVDYGDYTPKELTQFAESFRKIGQGLGAVDRGRRRCAAVRLLDAGLSTRPRGNRSGRPPGNPRLLAADRRREALSSAGGRAGGAIHPGRVRPDQHR